MTMKKIDIHSPEAQSADLLAGNMAQLEALFPEGSHAIGQLQP